MRVTVVREMKNDEEWRRNGKGGGIYRGGKRWEGKV
jgi:hypothetical protein